MTLISAIFPSVPSWNSGDPSCGVQSLSPSDEITSPSCADQPIYMLQASKLLEINNPSVLSNVLPHFWQSPGSILPTPFFVE